MAPLLQVPATIGVILSSQSGIGVTSELLQHSMAVVTMGPALFSLPHRGGVPVPAGDRAPALGLGCCLSPALLLSKLVLPLKGMFLGCETAGWGQGKGSGSCCYGVVAGGRG